jgi:hypothetical protein
MTLIPCDHRTSTLPVVWRVGTQAVVSDLLQLADDATLRRDQTWMVETGAEVSAYLRFSTWTNAATAFDWRRGRVTDPYRIMLGSQ